MMFKTPTEVDGTSVSARREPLQVRGEWWVTLVPDDGSGRLWEFSLTTGQLIQTMDGGD